MSSRFIPIWGTGAKSSANRRRHCRLGANVGDTAAAMIKHTNADILCVEPTNVYYALLKKNIPLLDPQGVRLKTLQAFISDKNKDTKRMSRGEEPLYKRSLCGRKRQLFLSEAIEQCGILLANVCVIKTSTSGNDAGAVLSLGDALDDMEPIFLYRNRYDDGWRRRCLIASVRGILAYGFLSGT